MNKIVFVLLAVALLSASVFLMHHKKAVQTPKMGVPQNVIDEYLTWKALFGKHYSADYIEAYKINVFYANW